MVVDVTVNYHVNLYIFVLGAYAHGLLVPFFPTCRSPFRKFFFSATRTAVDNYRQVLHKLHNAFLGQVIVTVDSNIFLILAEVKTINENVKEFRKDITELMKDVGR